MSHSCSSAILSFMPPFFLTILYFPLFFFPHSQTATPFHSYGFCYPPSPGGSCAFPVILLERGGWSSLDFIQTVGSAMWKGLVLDLQSPLIVLSSFKQPVDNTAPSPTHKINHWHIVVGFHGDCCCSRNLRCCRLIICMSELEFPFRLY